MKRIFLLMLFTQLVLSQVAFSQVGTGVGIATTNPTETLDVNGSMRVGNLTRGTVVSNSTGVLNVAPYEVSAGAVVSNTGVIFKQFGVSSVINLGAGRFRVFLAVAQPDNDYLIQMGADSRTVSYSNVTITSFDLAMSSNGGTYDFNFIIYRIN
jgi:hypothetical protein